jgi:hypothetical protein
MIEQCCGQLCSLLTYPSLSIDKDKSMDRRELFSFMGAAGAGFVIQEGHSHAAPHAAATGAPHNPMTGPHAHFCGIHVAKNNPRFQLMAQHYCTAHAGHDHDDGLFQCLLFDSTEPNAKLLGVEYIVSHEQYKNLPDDEKKFWHPHTYEVLAGGLIAPEMSAAEEMSFMRQILTTWGKTWHTWPDPATSVPIGEPLLMWALSGDGQVDDEVVRQRDGRFQVSISEIRRRRTRAIGLEVPNVPFPKSNNEIGRQWTPTGPDVPTPL